MYASNELSSSAEELDAQANDMNSMMSFYSTTQSSNSAEEQVEVSKPIVKKQVKPTAAHDELDLRSFERF